MIVVDTNVIVYYCTATPMQAAAQALRRADPDWVAPELWQSELLNVVAGEMRRRGMSLAGAMDVMADADRCVLAADQPDVQQVLRLVASSRCTAYDLQFVALAQRLQSPLVTMDHELLQAFPDIARPLVPF